MNKTKLGIIIAVLVILAGIKVYSDFISLKQAEIDNKYRIEDQRMQAEKEAKYEENSQKIIREIKLNECLAGADEIYWDYVRLNGTDQGEGTYRASNIVWDNAQKRKDSEEDKCFKLYK